MNLKDYHVFVTAVDGAVSLYVANKTATSFEVRDIAGAGSAAFDYRIVAKRKGYEATRLESPTISAKQ